LPARKIDANSVSGQQQATVRGDIVQHEKESVLRVWHERKAAVKNDAAEQERRVKAIEQKLDRLDEAFIFAKTIDLDTYERQRDRLREELTLAQIDRHTSELEELDVEGIRAFAERVLPRASDLWAQASLDQQQRLQQLFFPEGLAFDGRRSVRTHASSSAFNYLTTIEPSKTNLVDQNIASWNRVAAWLRRIESIYKAA
jgi:hypothetical protein